MKKYAALLLALLLILPAMAGAEPLELDAGIEARSRRIYEVQSALEALAQRVGDDLTAQERFDLHVLWLGARFLPSEAEIARAEADVLACQTAEDVRAMLAASGAEDLNIAPALRAIADLGGDAPVLYGAYASVDHDASVWWSPDRLVYATRVEDGRVGDWPVVEVVMAPGGAQHIYGPGAFDYQETGGAPTSAQVDDVCRRALGFARAHIRNMAEAPNGEIRVARRLEAGPDGRQALRVWIQEGVADGDYGPYGAEALILVDTLEIRMLSTFSYTRDMPGFERMDVWAE